MLDETRERLIVMGGTTEPGVFQVEVIEDGPIQGSILHATYRPRGFYDAPNDKCTCNPIYALTDEASRATRKALEFLDDGREFFTCACQSKRID